MRLGWRTRVTLPRHARKTCLDLGRIVNHTGWTVYEYLELAEVKHTHVYNPI